ncbi:(p)ppGpp synthetase [Spirochaetia bacterium]|nr:(p)ppGpp synthetase [Spirochaetia bacterium]
MKKNKLPDRQILAEMYAQRKTAMLNIARELKKCIEEAVQDLPTPPTIKGRPKEFTSFFNKYIRILKGNAPDEGFPRITDLIGIRVVCPFLEDVDTATAMLGKLFDIVEVERKGSNYSFKEFGYESTHILVTIPENLTKVYGDCGCDVAEIQVRTILQDAWAEVEHELVYKADFTPFDDLMKRKLAAVNANLSLADIIFQEIRTYQRQLNGEMGKRRYSFFKKIEDATDSLLFEAAEVQSDETPAGGEKTDRASGEFKHGVKGSSSMDDLLLNALYAHNKNQFNEAIYFYSRILEMNPDTTVRALVCKHRGMANFARSHYDAAIEDFSQSLLLDQKSYKSAYYRGLVKSVLQQYSDAVDDFTLSIAINPYQHYCLYRRGQAYYHLGDLPQALADCEAALVLEPNSTVALQFLEILRKKLRM